MEFRGQMSKAIRSVNCGVPGRKAFYRYDTHRVIFHVMSYSTMMSVACRYQRTTITRLIVPESFGRHAIKYHCIVAQDVNSSLPTSDHPFGSYKHSLAPLHTSSTIALPGSRFCITTIVSFRFSPTNPTVYTLSQCPTFTIRSHSPETQPQPPPPPPPPPQGNISLRSP